MLLGLALELFMTVKYPWAQKAVVENMYAPRWHEDSRTSRLHLLKSVCSPTSKQHDFLDTVSVYSSSSACGLAGPAVADATDC
jgi:hypothetical protein